MSERDYKALGFKAGLEIHQQLAGKKLFCNCPADVREDKPDFSVTRYLRASTGESGEIDIAASHEQAKQKAFVYQGYQDTTCLVEVDEEPVSKPQQTAVETGTMVAKMMHMTLVDTVHVMRKVVVDGSNTSGFQRTMLLALGGKINDVRLDRICLEEDSCKIISREADKDVYNLSRLGIPLLEITTKPDIVSPQHLQDIAAAIGMVLRSTGRVKRGLGTIRQDVNVSIKQGARVEIKGVQALDLIPLLADNEVSRQLALVDLAKKYHFKAKEVQEYVVVSKAIKTDKKWILDALKTGDAVGISLPRLKGLLGSELYSGFRLGTELSGFVKAWGFGGIIHDSEDPAKYGMSNWSDIQKLLGCSDEDGFVFVIGDGLRAKTVLSLYLPKRLEQLLSGVPSEVRKANDDGTTTYMRPMPGASRMYPETDVRSFRVDTINVDVPELLSERIPKIAKKYGIQENDAKELLRSDRLDMFEQFAGPVDPKLVYDVLVVREKDIERRQKIVVDTKVIAPEILERLSAGSISSSAIDDIMIAHAKNGSVDWNAYKPVDEAAVRTVIANIVASDKNAPFGALMGAAMKALGGKADGKLVSRLLSEELGK